MTIMQKILNALEINESVFLQKIFDKMELQEGKPLTKLEKATTRNALFKLSKKGLIDKEEVGRDFVYTLVKDKSEYTPRVFYTEKEKAVRKVRVSKVKTKTYQPLEWYSLRKAGQIENICKANQIPIPKTKDDIINFYNLYKQAI